jgi:hypothetical protein
MTIEPPIPLVSTTGRVQLTIEEIARLNTWLQQTPPAGTPLRATDATVRDILWRLLAHAAGAIYPIADAPVSWRIETLEGMTADDILAKRMELKKWLVAYPDAHPALIAEATKLLSDVVDHFWRNVP